MVRTRTNCRCRLPRPARRAAVLPALLRPDCQPAEEEEEGPVIPINLIPFLRRKKFCAS